MASIRGNKVHSVQYNVNTTDANYTALMISTYQGVSFQNRSPMTWKFLDGETQYNNIIITLTDHAICNGVILDAYH